MQKSLKKSKRLPPTKTSERCVGGIESTFVWQVAVRGLQCTLWDSNPWPRRHKHRALPTELRVRGVHLQHKSKISNEKVLYMYTWPLSITRIASGGFTAYSYFNICDIDPTSVCTGTSPFGLHRQLKLVTGRWNKHLPTLFYRKRFTHDGFGEELHQPTMVIFPTCENTGVWPPLNFHCWHVYLLLVMEYIHIITLVWNVFWTIRCSVSNFFVRPIGPTGSVHQGWRDPVNSHLHRV